MFNKVNCSRPQRKEILHLNPPAVNQLLRPHLDHRLHIAVLDPRAATDLAHHFLFVQAHSAISCSVSYRSCSRASAVYDYSLLQLVFCAHCDRIAAAEDNPKRRTRLSGSNTDKPRYRHAQGVQCGSKTRSIPAEALEGDFFRLVNLLALKEELLPSMLELAAKATPVDITDEELEKQKSTAIAKHKRRIEAARNLYEDGI